MITTTETLNRERKLKKVRELLKSKKFAEKSKKKDRELPLQMSLPSFEDMFGENINEKDTEDEVEEYEEANKIGMTGMESSIETEMPNLQSETSKNFDITTYHKKKTKTSDGRKSDSKFCVGRWSATEHANFTRGLKECQLDYSKISSDYVKTRTQLQGTTSIPFKVKISFDNL